MSYQSAVKQVSAKHVLVSEACSVWLTSIVAAWRCLGQQLGCGGCGRVENVSAGTGTLRGTEGKPRAGLLRRLRYLWHSLLGFGLFFGFVFFFFPSARRALLSAKRFLSRVCRPGCELLPPFLQAQQTAFFLLRGGRQDLKGIMSHHKPSLSFVLLLLSLGRLRRNRNRLRTFQKLKRPQKKLEMTVEIPAAFPWMKSPCQSSQRNWMLAAERSSQTQFLLIQDKRTPRAPPGTRLETQRRAALAPVRHAGILPPSSCQMWPQISRAHICPRLTAGFCQKMCQGGKLTQLPGVDAST